MINKIIILIGFLLSFSTLVSQNKNSKETADTYFFQMDYTKSIEIYKTLLKENPNDYELNWKVARALVNFGEVPGNEKKEYFEQAKTYAEKSISINHNGYEGMTFLAAAIGNLAFWGDNKMKINYSWQMKTILNKALEINPNDHIALSILGSLERMLANINWIEKTLANMIYGTSLPSGTYEDSIKYFLKAISIDSTLIRHHYELGLTYKDNKEYNKAKTEFLIALKCPVQLKADYHRIELIKEYLKDLQ